MKMTKHLIIVYIMWFVVILGLICHVAKLEHEKNEFDNVIAESDEEIKESKTENDTDSESLASEDVNDITTEIEEDNYQPEEDDYQSEEENHQPVEVNLMDLNILYTDPDYSEYWEEWEADDSDNLGNTGMHGGKWRNGQKYSFLSDSYYVDPSDNDINKIHQEYAINGEYDVFQCKFLLHQSAKNMEGRFYLKIYGDDTLIYTSEPLTGGSLPIDLNVDISNVKKMAIEISFEVDETIDVPYDRYYCGLIDPLLIKYVP